MLGYKSAKIAESAAKRKNEAGLTGSGQACGPVELPDGSWGFWTAHSVFDSSLPGVVLLPKGKFISGHNWKVYRAGFCSWKEILKWYVAYGERGGKYYRSEVER